MIRPTSRLLAAGLLTASLAPSMASAQSWVLTYEAPGAGATTSSLSSGGVETFNTRTLGTTTFNSNFSGSSISGTYSSTFVSTDFSLGFGATRYASSSIGFGGPTSFTLALNQAVNYFGYYLSAADAGNVVTFYSGAQQVGQFGIGQLMTTALAGNAAYQQVVPNFGWIESFAFVNFHRVGQTFDRIVFSQSQTGAHESDNHTIGNYLTIGGVTPVPEPGSIALMLAGLAGIGMAARRQRR